MIDVQKEDSKTILSLSAKLRLLLSGVNGMLWPKVCLNCRRSISENQQWLCDDCWAELMRSSSADYCPRCGKDVSKYAVYEGRCPLCQDKELHFHRTARVGAYKDALGNLLKNFKFKDRTELLNLLTFLAQSSLRGSSFYNKIDYIVPVPLHWKRRLTRGFNQAYIITRKLNHPYAVKSTDLVRIKNTRPQFTLTNSKERQENVRGAFVLRKDHPFEKRNVCLVDDIKTTDATLNECAKVLKDAGAHKVFVLVIAVAGQKDQ